MKASISLKNISTEQVSVEGIEVHFEYTVEEMLKLLEVYPQLLAQLLELTRS